MSAVAAEPQTVRPVLAVAIPWVEPIDEEQPFQIAAPPPPPPTPAELLGLTGKERAKAEKCLANAVYFESRGEPLRGQIAVAQVVLNRVFSPYYPNDVCSVVYQNADRHLACQFTFACDGKSKAIRDRRAWWRAQRVAKLTLDGKVWLAAVAKSTHYHANYVSPAWKSEMRRTYRYGVHLFYRPYRWGEGENEAGWVQAPLPVLKPKPQPVATQPRLKTTEQAPSASSATVQAKLDMPLPRAKPQATAGVAKAEPKAKDSKSPPNAKSPPASAQAKPAATQSKSKPTTKGTTDQNRPRHPATQSQLRPAEKVSLN